MSGHCYIAGAGEFCPAVLPYNDDFVIAADAGYRALIAHGIVPDLVVGDFDSLGSAPDHPNIVFSPIEKDDTDMMIAIKQGLARGYKTFIINGGLGDGLDHTIANIQGLVYLLKNDACGYLISRENCVTAIMNGTLKFKPVVSGRISVFCAGDKADGVTLTGLKYPLSKATLTCDFPLGVSNEFSGAAAAISVDSGILVVVWDGGLETLRDTDQLSF